MRTAKLFSLFVLLALIGAAGLPADSLANANGESQHLSGDALKPIMDLALDSPELLYNTKAKRFEVVFTARLHGEDLDVYFAYYDDVAQSWSHPFPLTVNDYDDTNPRFGVDKWGTRYVTWESAETYSHIYITRLAPQVSMWTTPLMISEEYESAHRPTLSISSKNIYVFYKVSEAVHSNGPDNGIRVWSAQEDIAAW